MIDQFDVPEQPLVKVVEGCRKLRNSLETYRAQQAAGLDHDPHLVSFYLTVGQMLAQLELTYVLRVKPRVLDNQGVLNVRQLRKVLAQVRAQNYA